MNTANHEQVVILGSGPAGLAAALYAARAQLSPLLVRGEEVGGVIATTNSVENYPGFPDGVGGFELFELMELHAERFGARFLDATVKRVDLSGRPFAIETDAGEIATETLIVATGAAPRTLGVPGETRLANSGVSYCATCDGPAFTGKTVVVVGGGNSALEEGLFLARYASDLVFVHRRAQPSAEPLVVQRAVAEPKATFVWNAIVTEIIGEEEVTAVRLRDTTTGEEWTIDAGGVFPFIGHLPNTDLFRGQLAMDERGYLKVDGRTRSAIPGVFAAGDVADPHYRQAVSAAGEGAKAAIEAARFLAARQPVAA